MWVGSRWSPPLFSVTASNCFYWCTWLQAFLWGSRTSFPKVLCEDVNHLIINPAVVDLNFAISCKILDWCAHCPIVASKVLGNGNGLVLVNLLQTILVGYFTFGQYYKISLAYIVLQVMLMLVGCYIFCFCHIHYVWPCCHQGFLRSSSKSSLK